MALVKGGGGQGPGYWIGGAGPKKVKNHWPKVYCNGKGRISV